MDLIEQDKEFNRFLNNWRKTLYDGYEESGLLDLYREVILNSSIPDIQDFHSRVRDCDCSTLPISICEFKFDPYPTTGELQPVKPWGEDSFYDEFAKEFPSAKEMRLYMEKYGFDGWKNYIYQLTLYYELLKTAQENKAE